MSPSTGQLVKPEPSKIDYERLIAITGKTNDISKMAIIAFKEFWVEEIRAGLFKSGDYNVYGMVPKGSKDEEKLNIKARFKYNIFET